MPDSREASRDGPRRQDEGQIDMRAKDISDDRFLDVVSNINIHEDRWAYVWDIEAAMPDIPPRLLRAKAKSLIKRGLMTGCTCGCRGDFEVTDPR